MKRNLTKKLATMGVAFSVFGLAGAAEALTLIPPGLNPGDQYRLVFVTSTFRDATGTNITDYNAFVNGVANAIPEIAALGTTWTAIGSTATVNAIDNTATTGSGGLPIYNFGALKVADNYPDLWDGSIDNPINITETDEVVSNPVFTGTSPLGVRTSLPLGRVGEVEIGQSANVNTGWVSSSQRFSDSPAPFYGISATLIVPGQPPTGVPEPSSLLGFIALGTFMLGGAVRKARQ